MKRRWATTSGASLLALLCSVAACSNASRWAGSVETQQGVEVIDNPGAPLLAEAQGLVHKLWDVQGSDWVDPSRIHVNSGHIAVVDPKANEVHLVSTLGEIQASVGRPGGGPGEIIKLVDAFPVGDSLVFLDQGKSSAEYLDLDGNYLSAVHLAGNPWNGFSLEDGTLLVKGKFLSGPSEGTLGDWVTVGAGEEPHAFTSLPLAPLPGEQGVQCSDFSAWADGAARLRFTTPQIQVFDRSGTLTLESMIDLPIERVSDAERDSALSNLRRSMAARRLPPQFMEQSLTVMKERWRVKCRFGPLRFDASRHYAAFMEQNPDQFGSGPATLHFVSADGIYLARVAFANAWRDFAMDGGVVYALTRDATTDLVTLTAFRVDLPPSVFEEAARVLAEARTRATAGRKSP